MNATVYTPENELSESVDYIWYHTVDHLHSSVVSIPFLHQELIFNFGDEFSVSTADRSYRYNAAGGLSGIYTTPVTTTAQGRYQALGILFKPSGIYRLFGLPAWQLAAPLQLHIDSRQLREAWEMENNPQNKIRLLEQFLLSAAQPKDIPALISDFLAITSEPLRKGHIRRYLHDKSHTPKQFIQAFKDILGLTPQTYLQLVQVNKAIRQIAGNTELLLTEVAYDQGFYDQAHFIRVFKKFSGMSPLQYRKAVISNRVFPPFPNTIFCGRNSVQFFQS